MNCHCCSGKVRKCGSFRNKNRLVQRYRCTRCGKTSSEDQPFNDLRIDDAKIVQIVKLLGEGLGVRACARLADCHIETVLSVLQTVGTKLAAFLDRNVRNLTVPSLQIDELWSRVFCAQKNTHPSNPEHGDFYTFLALDARTKLIISHFTGKRDGVSTNKLVADFASRIVGRLQITSDAWRSYPAAIRHHLLYRLDYAIMQKNFAAPPAEVEASRRYSPAPFIGVTIKTIAGAPRADRICTSHVERVNLSVRHYCKRFVRLGLGYSRKLENHRLAVSLFVAVYNYTKVHSTLGCTPAVGAKLTTETWTIERLLQEATKSTN